jgi:hypothetical protein
MHTGHVAQSESFVWQLCLLPFPLLAHLFVNSTALIHWRHSLGLWLQGSQKKVPVAKTSHAIGEMGKTKAGNNRVIILVWNNCEYGQVLEDRACAPSTEDLCLKPFWANSLRDPISKKQSEKKGWWSGSRWRPDYTPQYWKQKLWIW